MVEVQKAAAVHTVPLAGPPVFGREGGGGGGFL